MFEYDEDKSQINKDKHGIDFKAVQALWEDEDLFVMAAREASEKRFLTIGMIENKYWTVISTMRMDNIRIISARRSRKKEIEIYESRRSG